ncbi:hypothetical protein PENSPDRAFT_334214 [Peniophora sp. CONT]|nr:hypothetical protein PENSPDRAFT_334214 [Peniophora sp. CONT]
MQRRSSNIDYDNMSNSAAAYSPTSHSATLPTLAQEPSHHSYYPAPRPCLQLQPQVLSVHATTPRGRVCASKLGGRIWRCRRDLERRMGRVHHGLVNR